MGESLMTMHITLVLSTLAVLLHETVHAQMQFEIPQEMLGQMFGGGQQRQQQRQPKETTWPKWAKTDIAPEFQWLINTEWAGKTSKYSLLRDGIIESSLKANKSGKKTKLGFSKVVADENEDAMIAEDLYTLLGVTPDIETKKIKSSYRRLSVKVHPDKCAPSDKEECQKKFDELRQAF